MGKSGILYVVGTGPGSSELMTLGGWNRPWFF